MGKHLQVNGITWAKVIAKAGVSRWVCYRYHLGEPGQVIGADQLGEAPFDDAGYDFFHLSTIFVSAIVTEVIRP